MGMLISPWYRLAHPTQSNTFFNSPGSFLPLIPLPYLWSLVSRFSLKPTSWYCLRIPTSHRKPSLVELRSLPLPHTSNCTATFQELFIPQSNLLSSSARNTVNIQKLIACQCDSQPKKDIPSRRSSQEQSTAANAPTNERRKRAASRREL